MHSQRGVGAAAVARRGRRAQSHQSCDTAVPTLQQRNSGVQRKRFFLLFAVLPSVAGASFLMAGFLRASSRSCASRSPIPRSAKMAAIISFLGIALLVSQVNTVCLLTPSSLAGAAPERPSRMRRVLSPLATKRFGLRPEPAAASRLSDLARMYRLRITKPVGKN